MLSANSRRKEQLQHRAVSLRQRGFLVLYLSHVNYSTGDRTVFINFFVTLLTYFIFYTFNAFLRILFKSEHILHS